MDPGEINAAVIEWQQSRNDLLFETIWRELQPLLHKAAVRYRHVIDDAEIDSTLNLALFLAAEAYDPAKSSGGKFSSFAYLIAQRKLISIIASMNRERDKVNGETVHAVSLDEPMGEDGDDATLSDVVYDENAILPDEEICRAEEIDALSSLSSRLTRREKSAFQGKLEGKSYQQIADERGLSCKQIDNDLHRSRQKMRRLKSKAGESVYKISSRQRRIEAEPVIEPREPVVVDCNLFKLETLDEFDAIEPAKPTAPAAKTEPQNPPDGGFLREPQATATPTAKPVKVMQDKPPKPVKEKLPKPLDTEPPTADEIANAFWRHIEKVDDCWLWRGVWRTQGRQGVGQLSIRKRFLTASRVAWTLTHPADALTRKDALVRTCDSERCVCPAHHRMQRQGKWS